MSSEQIRSTGSLRVALRLAAAVNLLGVLVFGTAATGHPLLALPVDPPPFYAAQTALTIGIFGAVYAWLARQPMINRPLLLVGASGKLGFFVLFLVYWVVGDLGWIAVAQATPDLALGLAFLWHWGQGR